MNILLIQTDQRRRDCLGAYGNSIVRTPNIDRLADVVNSLLPEPAAAREPAERDLAAP